MRLILLSVLLLFAMLFPSVVSAHPLPAVPIRADFEPDGSVTFRVEIETRIFEEEPELVQYLYLKDFLTMGEEERTELVEKARTYVEDRFQLIFEPGGEIKPDFTFRFTTWNNEPLKGAYDYVILTGTWKTQVPEGSTGYKVHATEKDQYTVESYALWQGQPLERWAGLWPNETSFTLDLAKLSQAPTATDVERHDFGPVVVSFARAGFMNVLPWSGIAFAGFVAALMLLARDWKSRMTQLGVYAAALAAMLVFGAAGIVNLPGWVVAPVLGVSVVVVALDNLFKPVFSRWRLLIVLVFGLVHGASLAAVLGDYRLVSDGILPGVSGFLAGVLGADLGIALVLGLLTFWLSDIAFRKFVAVPGSIALVILGGFLLVS